MFELFPVIAGEGVKNFIFLWPFFLLASLPLQIDFDISGHWAEPIIYSSQDDWSFNLKTILEWSPFASKSELLQQVFQLNFIRRRNISVKMQSQVLPRQTMYRSQSTELF